MGQDVLHEVHGPFLSKDPSFLHWLAGRCVPANRGEGNLVQNKHLHVGSQCVHFTHELKEHSGSFTVVSPAVERPASLSYWQSHVNLRVQMGRGRSSV